MWSPYELIKKKRDGLSLTPEEIAELIAGYSSGRIPDYQMSALCMAVFFKGLSEQELSAWTSAMLHSGVVLDLAEIPGCKVDKHSTGGVGDKVSLSLAPLAAACGVRVPMISGRGLGHTGGTLDKLESIPGFRVDLSIPRYRELVRTVGACLIGQTADLAPADKRLYALRDVTATVDCIPLITSSILSKKLAEGIDALVLDVKVGTGAFMKDLDNARTLARTLVKIGCQMGKRVVAYLTRMEQPLGRAVGNALEVQEAIDLLRGEAPPDLTECTLTLTAEMLCLARVAGDPHEAREKLQRAIADGSALRKLAEIVEAQGGDPRVTEDPGILPRATQVVPIGAPVSGFVSAIDTEAIGRAAVALGAGRERVESTIDPAVGFVFRKKLGDRVEAGEPLVQMHLNDASRSEEITRRIQASYQFSAHPVSVLPLVIERLDVG